VGRWMDLRRIYILFTFKIRYHKNDLQLLEKLDA
jgi:hypothetical protein